MRRTTRKPYSAEEQLRIVLEGRSETEESTQQIGVRPTTPGWRRETVPSNGAGFDISGGRATY